MLETDPLYAASHLQLLLFKWAWISSASHAQNPRFWELFHSYSSQYCSWAPLLIFLLHFYAGKFSLRVSQGDIRPVSLRGGSGQVQTWHAQDQFLFLEISRGSLSRWGCSLPVTHRSAVRCATLCVMLLGELTGRWWPCSAKLHCVSLFRGHTSAASLGSSVLPVTS